MESKVAATEELIVIDKNFVLTLPGVALLQREKDEKLNREKVQKMIGGGKKGKKKQVQKLDAIL